MRLIEALAGSCEQNSDSLAVIDSCQSLTYGQLWAAAKGLSADLLSLNSPVCVVKEKRSAHLLVRLLGIWLADKVPLLLDPDTPELRLNEVLRVTSAAIPERTEYLVSTSGSMGQPKLILIGEGSLFSVVSQQRERFGVTADSRLLWMLNPGFDASLSDIGVALLAGASLYCAEETDFSNLPSLVEEYGITYLDIPPSVLALYQPGDFPKHLETLVVGGERSCPARLRNWALHYNLFAVYGPAEATVCSSVALVDESWDKHYLGAALKEVEYRVEEGELLIGGSHLGLGYLNQVAPDRNPWMTDAEGKFWYRTGDRVGARHSEFGYEFLGRQDRQIQLRGQRLELTELERQAAESLGHDGVAVSMRQGHLCLFWESLTGNIAEEKAKLQSALEAHFVASVRPRFYVPLKCFPRTASHKIAYHELATLDLATEACNEEQGFDSLARLGHQIGLNKVGLKQKGKSSMEESCLMSRLPNAKPFKSKRLKTGKKKLVMTGGSGRLGRALRPFLEESFEVWNLTRSPQSNFDIKADFRLEGLGLSSRDWRFLEQEIGSVVNLAAEMSLSSSFEEATRINVDALEELMKLACPIHQASTLAIPLLTQDECVSGVYSQTKFLAECLLQRAQLPGFTFRYGNLIGTPSPRDLLFIVIKTLLDLGCYPSHPESTQIFFDVTPTEWAATETLSYLKTAPEGRELVSLRRGWQLSFHSLIETILERYALAPISSKEFFSLPVESDSQALGRLALSRLDPHPGTNGWQASDLFLLTNSRLSLESDEQARSCLVDYLEETL